MELLWLINPINRNSIKTPAPLWMLIPTNTPQKTKKIRGHRLLKLIHSMKESIFGQTLSELMMPSLSSLFQTFVSVQMKWAGTRAWSCCCCVWSRWWSAWEGLRSTALWWTLTPTFASTSTCRTLWGFSKSSDTGCPSELKFSAQIKNGLTGRK